MQLGRAQSRIGLAILASLLHDDGFYGILSKAFFVISLIICLSAVTKQPAKRAQGRPLSRLREADLLFGARFFSYRDIEGLLCKINHGRIGMGTELLQFQSFAEALYLCVFLL